MRLKDTDIRQIAHTCAEELRVVSNRERHLNDALVREALCAAQMAGKEFPRIDSPRSLAMVAEEFVERIS